MRARHRLSKLLLRHGLVYDATAWTLAHDAWLRRQRFAARPLAARASTSATRPRCRRRRAGTRSTRRSPSSPASRRSLRSSAGSAVCAASRTLTAFALDGRARRLEPLPAADAGPVPRPDSERGLQRGAARLGRDHQDRQHARAPAARRGGLAPTASAARERDARARAGRGSRPPCAPKPTAARAGCTDAGTRSSGAASAARSSRSPSRASSPDTAGRSRRWTSPRPQRLGEESAAAQRTRGATRGTATSSPTRRRSTLESGSAPQLAHPVMRSQPAHISRDTTRRQQPLRSPRRNKKARKRGPSSRAT